ncbi:MAG: hypothetical protein ABJE95_22585 [Byssovorax sp.]
MAYYEDLGPCDYFGPINGQLLAVGWLDREHAISKGQVTPQFFESLARLVANVWQPFVLAGRHPCEFCIFTGGPSEVQVGDISVSVGAANVFVPTAEGVYVAPSLVLHYIDAHEYAPPDAFRRAVEACPEMRSMAYLKAIRQHGINRLGVRGGGG